MSTIIEVARRAGVSIAAVSLTMNAPDTHRVSDKTKTRIRKAALDLCYTPNRHAKALLSKKTQVLGLVLPMLPPLAINDYIAEAVSGIQAACSLRGYNLMLYPHSSETGRITPTELHSSMFADGLIFMHTRMTTKKDIEETSAALLRERRSFVMLNGPALSEEVFAVGVNDEAVGRQGTAYLIGKGHRRIAVLAGSHHSPSTPAFLSGVRASMRAAGGKLSPEMLRFSEFDPNRTARAVHEWLQLKEPPTAVFCAYDQLVPALYRVLRERKIKIPGTMAILGRGDLPFAEHLYPALTTFHVPIFEMGQRAADLLFQQIDEHPSSIGERQEFLPCALVERESV